MLIETRLPQPRDHTLIAEIFLIIPRVTIESISYLVLRSVLVHSRSQSSFRFPYGCSHVVYRKYIVLDTNLFPGLVVTTSEVMTAKFTDSSEGKF